jgi:hypothetical protein
MILNIKSHKRQIKAIVSNFGTKTILKINKGLVWPQV